MGILAAATRFSSVHIAAVHRQRLAGDEIAVG
jgi:hypothetical protein